MGKSTQSTRQNRDAQIIAGFGKRMQNVSSITLTGTTYATSDLTKAFAAQISALASVVALKAQLKDAVAAAKSQEKQLSGLARALRSYLINEYGNTAAVLGDFGFAPDTVPKKDPVTKVVAAARMRATRLERGTKGPVAKQSIKGTVPATLSVDTRTLETAPTPATPTTTPLAPQGTTARPAGTQ